MNHTRLLLVACLPAPRMPCPPTTNDYHLYLPMATS